MNAIRWAVLGVTTVAIVLGGDDRAAAAHRVYKRGWFGREVYREHWLGEAGAGVLTHLITTAGPIAGSFVSGLSGGQPASDGENRADEEKAQIEQELAESSAMREQVLSDAEARADKMLARAGIEYKPPAAVDSEPSFTHGGSGAAGKSSGLRKGKTAKPK